MEFLRSSSLEWDRRTEVQPRDIIPLATAVGGHKNTFNLCSLSCTIFDHVCCRLRQEVEKLRYITGDFNICYLKFRVVRELQIM